MLAAVTAVSLSVGLTALAAVKTPDVRDLAQGRNPIIGSSADGHLHVVYEGMAKGAKAQDILYCESSDEGATWSPPVNVSNTPGVSKEPDMVVEKSGAIDVVWCDSTADEKYPDIFFARSTDSGKSWTQPVDIASTPGRSTDPCIAVGPDNTLHVAWGDTSTGEKNQDIYYSSSTDGGQKWGNNPLLPAVDISSTPGTSSEATLIVDDSGTVHAAWVDTSSGKERPDVYYSQKSKDSWSKAVDISNTKGASTHPTLACNNGKLYLAWSENTPQEKNPDIWCAVATDGKFAKAFNVSNSPGVSTGPVMLADKQDRVALVWSDTASGDNKPDVYGRFSFDGLKNVSKLMDISNTESSSKNASITMIGDKIFLIWEELVGSKVILQTKSMGLKGISTGPVGGDYLRI